MKMKCIGGLANGQIVDVPYSNEYDQIQVPAKVTFEIQSFEEGLSAFREGRTPDSMIVPYHYYQVGCIQWIDEGKNKRKLFYLHPIKWNKFEALAYLIGI